MGKKGRHSYSLVLPTALRIQKTMTKYRIRSTICGSVRRKRPEVGDVDLVVSCSIELAMGLVKAVCRIDKIGYEVLSAVKPESKKGDIRVGKVVYNIYRAGREDWGAMTLFLTGNMLFNIVTRTLAQRLGYKLSQYGLFHHGELLAGKSEKQILDCLGMDYLSPMQREFTNTQKKEYL